MAPPGRSSWRRYEKVPVVNLPRGGPEGRYAGWNQPVVVLGDPTLLHWIIRPKLSISDEEALSINGAAYERQ